MLDPAKGRPLPGRLGLRWVLLLLAALAGAGCTALVPAPPLQRDAACAEWTRQLDAAIGAAGVADAESQRIPGFAGLRTDRLGAALREPARQHEAAFQAWLQRAAALDAAARRVEVGNLPPAAFPLAGAAQAGEALVRTDACRQRLLAELGAPGTAPPAGPFVSAPLRQALLQQADVPPRYSTGLRTLGLYPLVRWPFYAGVQGWQDAQQAAMARWAAGPPTLRRYGPAPPAPPAAGPPAWPPAEDALGLPQPSPAQAAALLAWHAPVFEVQQQGPYDQFGRPAWGAEGQPGVDTRQPAVYQRLAHTRWNGRWLLQLVYTLWFPERPARMALDLLAGRLDGVVLRITLDAQGQPLLVDSMHACGCYHMFFPGAALQARLGAPRGQEWLFAPAPLPPLGPAQRLRVQLASATHHVMALGAVPRGSELAGGVPAAASYELRPEDELRSLPTLAGRRSLYGPDGLVAGTERGERFLFWPMGIASPGAMRQWGHHATAFVGRRHFDDADLLELRFEPAPAPM